MVDQVAIAAPMDWVVDLVVEQEVVAVTVVDLEEVKELDLEVQVAVVTELAVD